MERLSKASPAAKLTDKQRAELAEIDSKYAAKIAERELLLQDEFKKAAAKGDMEALQQIEKQMVSNRKTLEAEREEKKDKVRSGGKG